MPVATIDGRGIEDKEDFIRQYRESEKAKYGREISREEAEAEVDEWLLRQATFAPSKMSATDMGLALVVFVAAFGGGLMFANQGGS